MKFKGLLKVLLVIKLLIFWSTAVSAQWVIQMAIGEVIVNGTSKAVLYDFTSSGTTRLAEDPSNFNYDPATKTLTVTNCSGCAGASATLVVGTTPITSGTTTRVLFDAAAILGESASFTYTSGTGVVNATAFSTLAATPASVGDFRAHYSTGAFCSRNSGGSGDACIGLNGNSWQVDFGISTSFFSSNTGGVATSGTFRAANNEGIFWGSGQGLVFDGTSFHFGIGDSATPAAQNLRVQGSRPGTDTNIAGGAFNLYPGISTGSATNNATNVNIYKDTVGSTGTAAQIQTLAFSFGHSATLTSGSATALFDIVLPSALDYYAGNIIGMCYGNDGTHTSIQNLDGGNGTGHRFACANDNGTVTCAIVGALSAAPAFNTNAGVLALSSTMTGSQSVSSTTATIKMTCTNGTGTATTLKYFYTIIDGSGTVSPSNFQP